MRALPSPGFYGSVDRGPVPHRYFFSREKKKTLLSPALFRRKENSEKPSRFAHRLCGPSPIVTAFSPIISLAISHRHFAIVRLPLPTEISTGRMCSSERSLVLSQMRKKSMKSLLWWTGKRRGGILRTGNTPISSPYCSGLTTGQHRLRRFSIPCRWRAP